MKLIAILSVLYLISIGSAKSQATSSVFLFKPEDRSHWFTYLQGSGKNKDSLGVFRLEKGMIHVSGQKFGYIATEESYSNFHLKLEFKWGEKKYPPRDADTTKRDNGICFYMPLNEKDLVWPKSIECQVQEGDVGDIWLIDSTTVVIEGKRTEPNDYTRVKKKKDGEKPNGEWNRVEVIVKEGQITYIVNGIVVNEAKSPSLNEGKIIIQSEGAEIYYRKIEITELN